MKPERGAFCEDLHKPDNRCVGLTVRAYIATQMMHGLLTSPHLVTIQPGNKIAFSELAEFSIEATDALLKALEP